MPPRRRQSIAANPTAVNPRPAINKKRSASIAPGETTALVSDIYSRMITFSPSPQAPRKSILKSAFTFNVKQQNGQDSITLPSNSAVEDDESTENATDFTTEIHDNVGRKSIGRRVSFAPQAHVRCATYRLASKNTLTTRFQVIPN